MGLPARWSWEGHGVSKQRQGWGDQAPTQPHGPGLGCRLSAPPASWAAGKSLI